MVGEGGTGGGVAGAREIVVIAVGLVEEREMVDVGADVCVVVVWVADGCVIEVGVVEEREKLVGLVER
jgi:acyl-[acyl carrier protein]--UDP-N-acetylglucosamine O-acyltransferase